MSFPTTSVLDNCTRANENPLSHGGDWVALSGYDEVGTPPALVSNAVVGTNVAEDSSSYWHATVFGPDMESYFTLVALPASGEMVANWVRINNATNSATFQGYQIRFKKNGDGAGHDQILFLRYDPGPAGTILSTVTLGANFATTDQFGVNVVGTVLSAFRNGASIASYDTNGDATKYTGTGVIGFTIRNQTATFAPYGGGTVVAGGPPVNTVAPAVTGTTTVGQVLTTSNGTWTNSPTFTYQWQRDNFGSGAFSNIAAATASTYTLVDADDTCHVRCVVTGTNGSGSAAANSNSVGPIVEPVPVNTVAPVISGNAHRGSVLVTTTGGWSNQGNAFSLAYQWKRAGVNIGGATLDHYQTVTADIGNAIGCTVTATNSGGSTSQASANTITVIAAIPDSGSGSIAALVFLLDFPNR